VVDAVENIHRLDLSFWKALVANGSGGVEVIMSPGAPFVSRDRSIEDFRGVIRFARSMYDWTVVDLGRGLTLMAKAVIEEIDDLFIITPLEVPALHQTKAMIRSLSELGYPSHRMHVLINRMPKRSEITLDELESMLGVTVYGTLPSDYPSLYEAYSEGQMLSPNSKLGKSLTQMTAKLAGLEEAPKKKFLFAF
jgi:pilus assembly protein CpaE